MDTVRLCVALVVLAVATTLQGCGGGTTTPAPTPGPGPTPGPTPAPSPGPPTPAPTPGPPTPAGLKFRCTEPALGVAYSIKYYNGTVDCGNLLLESDIGGTHASIPPKISFPSASAGFYTLMYIDPDAFGNGSWPVVTTPGSHAPVRHWVIGNIAAEMLKTGNLSGATTVSAFKGPSPPQGSHRYGQFLFRQSGGKLNFTILPSPANITNWNYTAFIEKYKLGDVVASNYHITQHMPPRPNLSSSVAAHSLASGLKFECTKTPLGVAYDIKYYSGTVKCGNLLLESDIGGTHPWIPPKITFTAPANTFYTLMYLDPWVNLPNNGSWPDVTTPGSKATARHWVVGNINADMLKTGNLTGATTVSKFKGPSPPWGSHPYGQFLFRQSAGNMTFEVLPSPSGIYNWNYTAFIAKHNLSAPVASNFHVTQHMDPRPTQIARASQFLASSRVVM